MTKVTYVTLPLSNQQKAANCIKLADLLERLTPEQHRQEIFINACGTAGCALGWAALSNKFPGLQWTHDRDLEGFSIDYLQVPVVNGNVSNWLDVSAKFFGLESWAIFGNSDHSRETIIESLRKLARRLSYETAR